MQLMLMRHAETEIDPTKKDIDRHLTEYGKIQANEAALFLQKNYHIKKIIISFAKRTKETFTIINEVLDLNSFEITKKLYMGNENSIIELISSQKLENNTILIVGHNPLIYSVALLLTDNQSKQYTELAYISIKPAEIIVIDFKNLVDWNSIQINKGIIFDRFTPR